jgi:hypothetical protein
MHSLRLTVNKPYFFIASSSRAETRNRIRQIKLGRGCFGSESCIWLNQMKNQKESQMEAPSPPKTLRYGIFQIFCTICDFLFQDPYSKLNQGIHDTQQKITKFCCDFYVPVFTCTRSHLLPVRCGTLDS